MVSALNSELSSPSLCAGWGHFCSWARHFYYSYGASLHPGVQMGISEFSVGDNPVMD